MEPKIKEPSKNLNIKRLLWITFILLGMAAVYFTFGWIMILITVIYLVLYSHAIFLIGGGILIPYFIYKVIKNISGLKHGYFIDSYKTRKFWLTSLMVIFVIFYIYSAVSQVIVTRRSISTKWYGILGGVEKYYNKDSPLLGKQFSFSNANVYTNDCIDCAKPMTEENITREIECLDGDFHTYSHNFKSGKADITYIPASMNFIVQDVFNTRLYGSEQSIEIGNTGIESATIIDDNGIKSVVPTNEIEHSQFCSVTSGIEKLFQFLESNKSATISINFETENSAVDGHIMIEASKKVEDFKSALNELDPKKYYFEILSIKRTKINPMNYEARAKVDLNTFVYFIYNKSKFRGVVRGLDKEYLEMLTSEEIENLTKYPSM